MEEEATVFIVDDHPATGHSLSWLLRQAELPVQTFSSGREFLEAYQSGKPGCLVLDVSMPVMTGREVQREFSARRGIADHLRRSRQRRGRLQSRVPLRGIRHRGKTDRRCRALGTHREGDGRQRQTESSA